MSRFKVQNTQLAALREFRKGMDLEDYMSTEFRQTLRALKNMFVDFGGGFDLTATRAENFNLGRVAITKSVLKSGTLTSDLFKPQSDGKYWVEFGMEMNTVAGGTLVNNLILKFEDGTINHTLTASVIAAQGVKYVSGKCFMDLSASRGAYFDFTGNANTVGFNFHCSFIKVN